MAEGIDEYESPAVSPIALTEKTIHFSEVGSPKRAVPLAIIVLFPEEL